LPVSTVLKKKNHLWTVLKIVFKQKLLKREVLPEPVMDQRCPEEGPGMPQAQAA
jgi:hypothetical protein